MKLIGANIESEEIFQKMENIDLMAAFGALNTQTCDALKERPEERKAILQERERLDQMMRKAASSEKRPDPLTLPYAVSYR